MLIADAQVHIWAADSPKRPWPKGNQVHPQRAIPLGAEELLDTIDEVGVDRVVLVPPSWEGNHPDLVIAAASAHPERFASMPRIDLATPRSLADWRAQPGVLGVRTIFFLPEQQAWLEDGTADWLWREAEAHGLPMMIFAPNKTEALAQIARLHPGMQLVIDHCNLHLDVFDEHIGPALEPVLGLSELENVAVKISAFPCHVHETYPFPSLKGHIRRIVAAFGPERCMWGSDLSRLPCPYADWKNLFVGDELEFLDQSDKELILGKSLATILDWPE